LLILTLYSADAAKAFGSYMVVFDVLLVFSAVRSLPPRDLTVVVSA